MGSFAKRCGVIKGAKEANVTHRLTMKKFLHKCICTILSRLMIRSENASSTYCFLQFYFSLIYAVPVLITALLVSLYLTPDCYVLT